MDVLSHRYLIRPGTNSSGASTQERQSIDFLINGASLLAAITKVNGGHDDFMGCLVLGYPEQNAQAIARLTCTASPDSESGRVLIYICPECGDIGCGAYSARVERIGENFVWQDFAYENGYEEPEPLDGFGPYIFMGTKYKDEIYRAGAL